MPHPPEVADLILRGLLPLDMRETVSGDLLEEYRESRVPALTQELALLDRAIERVHVFPEDVARARVADTQGLGGAPGP